MAGEQPSPLLLPAHLVVRASAPWGSKIPGNRLLQLATPQPGPGAAKPGRLRHLLDVTARPVLPARRDAEKKANRISVLASRDGHHLRRGGS
jgi:hypothetical protein